MITGVAGAERAGVEEQKQVPPPRLVRAAHEFEAQMMKELLAPMTRSDALFREGDGEDSGILGEFAAESLAGALSAGGGFGIGDRIIHSFGGGASSAPRPFIGNRESNFGIGTNK
jgi:Rod binding domain-containing protein